MARGNGRAPRPPFVYGEGDGHLASIGAPARRFGPHPAQTYSVAHHRDMAAAVRLGTLVHELGYSEQHLSVWSTS